MGYLLIGYFCGLILGFIIGVIIGLAGDEND